MHSGKSLLMAIKVRIAQQRELTGKIWIPSCLLFQDLDVQNRRKKSAQEEIIRYRSLFLCWLLTQAVSTAE